MGMKTAISIPDEIFQEAERLAKRLKQSRSELYSRAMAEYLARHAPDKVTEAMDAVLEEVSEPADDFAPAAGRRALRRTEW
jgi:metal-responsive CopG/Arc/MetJ family transcriptional regulator